MTKKCFLSALLSTTRSMSPTSLSLAPTRSLSVRAETVICFMGVAGWAGAVADGWASLVLGEAGVVARPAGGAAGVGAGLGAVEGAGAVCVWAAAIGAAPRLPASKAAKAILIACPPKAPPYPCRLASKTGRLGLLERPFATGTVQL